jgi:hypothetical protein
MRPERAAGERDVKTHGRISALLFATLLLAPALSRAQPEMPPPLMPRGLITKEARVSPGYVLFGPILSDTVYLVDNDGRVVHTWETGYAGSGDYLLPNGHLLRGGRDPKALHFRAGGVTGILQELDWDGNVVWEWKLSDEKRILHHDIEPLPNGNILAIAWEGKDRAEVLDAGRRPENTPAKGLHPDWVLEIQRVGSNQARIVWEWHVWDHLVQDQSPQKPSFGGPSEHPERLDINALTAAAVSPEELEQLKALGYVPEDAVPEDLAADFLHINAIDYHPGLDQFALSVPELGEVWIVDHSTTTREAAGSTGGRAGRGGDLLYRWGNPASYGRGDGSSQRLFYQHDVRWIPEGFPGAGHLMIFDNGRDRPEGPWSLVAEIALPLRPDGSYAIEDGLPYAPKDPTWSWKLPADHFSPFISGAERLENGNTLVCAGPDGSLLEVTSDGRIVWDYRNPFGGSMRLEDGSSPQPGLDQLPYALFRATRIPPDHSGLQGRSLKPLAPQPAWAPDPGQAPERARKNASDEADRHTPR